MEEDILFIDKKSELDKELENLGVYNDNIKVWYYHKYNPALATPIGKCLKEEKLSREYYDVYQIGVILIDMITKGLILDINL